MNICQISIFFTEETELRKVISGFWNSCLRSLENFLEGAGGKSAASICRPYLAFCCLCLFCRGLSKTCEKAGFPVLLPLQPSVFKQYNFLFVCLHNIRNIPWSCTDPTGQISCSLSIHFSECKSKMSCRMCMCMLPSSSSSKTIHF